MREILKNMELSMQKTLEFLKKDLGAVNAGRATPSLLDTVKVEAYGSYVPLNQAANVTAPDPLTLLVQVWDKSLAIHVEKAIAAANLGFNPTVDGASLRISVPKLSEERRKELCKIAKRYGEEKKVAVRNHRRDALEKVRKIKKEFSEDLVKDTEKEAQNLTDKYCRNIDDMVAAKEKDLLTLA
jgi:ribosome recycling factor